MHATPPLWQEFIKAARKEVVPALGCTEPISLALAAAIARVRLGRVPERIVAAVSPNLMKNGMGVTVPGTGMVGMPIAAAVGALAGDAEAGLQVLHALTPDDVTAARRMLDEGRVSIGVAPVDNVLYSEARLEADGHWARVAIADAHTRVVRIEVDGELVFERETEANAQNDNAYSLAGCRARDVFDFAMGVPLADIAFIAAAGELNTALSQTGMSGDYGLAIGATLQKNIERGILSDDLFNRVVRLTTAASDARMGGAMAPAMSNSGSGNQGIAASMPVVVVADHLGASDEQRIRALMLANLMAIYIKSFQHKLSALCAVTTAAMGSAAGMAWLLGGDYDTVARAICNMIGDVAGMICDGANNGCAMKVSSSVGAALKAVLLALDGVRVGGSDGIVSDDVDDTIRNLAALVNQGMVETDQQILRIMLDKR